MKKLVGRTESPSPIIRPYSLKVTLQRKEPTKKIAKQGLGQIDVKDEGKNHVLLWGGLPKELLALPER